MLKKIVVLLSLVLAGAAYGQTPEEMLRQAEQLETEGKLQRAIEVYETFVKKFSDHSQVDHANWRLAKCFDDQGLPEKAEAQLRKLVGNGKKNFRNRADAFYMLGKMQAADKKYAEAVVTFEKMLAEGAGLHEEEVLNLTGGYYAILSKFDEAAGKFNILRLRRDNAKAAEAASYKLVKLWLQAEKLDRAREAIKDLDQAFPDNKQLPELLFRLADGYRLKQKFDMTIGLCEQIRTRYPKSVEAIAGGYLLGLCYRDRGEHQKAVQALEQVGRVQDVAARPLAAEAMLAAAEIYLANLNDTPKAMSRYEEAASIARQTESERRSKILEQCYFRLGEYHFREKRYSVAREYYLLIRAQGSEINVLPRILECDGQLKKTDVSDSITTIDAEFLKKRVAENPGTFTALEAEVLLADRKLADVVRGRGVAVGVAADFEKLLSSYKKDVLAQDNVEAYIYSQIGACYATGASKEDLAKAMAAYEKLIASDPTDKNIYLIPALEAMAITADRAGDKARAAKARQDLFNHSKAKLDANKEDKGLEKKTLEYLKTLATHSEGDMVDQSIALCKKIIEEKGALSELSREARFNMAELYYLKKDYSNAARVYKEFVSIHGPKQDANGEVENAPWKPASGGIEVEQIFDAAIRVAHCWYMQHNDLDLKAQYEWIVRNFPLGNKYAVEAYYYLALEKAKGKEGQKKENKRAMADELWTKVVNPSQAFESADFKKSFYPWVGLPVDDPSNAGQYVRTAILRAGQAYSEIAEHELAARMFEQFLTLFGGGLERSGKGQQPVVSGDEMSDMARYALGREYIALNRISRMLEVYKPYLGGQRNSRFRISALKQMGYHAGKLKMYEAALNAYATLLDEYGEPLRNAQGDAIPVPANQRLRDNAPGWNGIRTPVPKELNLGEIRYALGFLYWKQENYRRCALALQPFAQDVALANNAHRPTAMFMAAQSYYKLYDYAQGVPLLQTLIREVPKFEAIEEIYELAARGLVALRQWNEVELLYKRFVAAWPNSGRRARLDLYNAASLLAGGNTAKGLAELRGLINGEYDQATKADALYYTARNNKNDKEAMQQFEQSLRYYAREASCLAAAQCAMRLGDLKRAQELLDRTIRDFPQGEPAVIAEARETLPKVLKELARKSK